MFSRLGLALELWSLTRWVVLEVSLAFGVPPAYRA
jgi:hypothetical protein